MFHVYFGNKNRIAYDASGNVIAMIEKDDTRSYGFETITFEKKFHPGFLKSPGCFCYLPGLCSINGLRL